RLVDILGVSARMRPPWSPGSDEGDGRQTRRTVNLADLDDSLADAGRTLARRSPVRPAAARPGSAAPSRPGHAAPRVPHPPGPRGTWRTRARARASRPPATHSKRGRRAARPRATARARGRRWARAQGGG